MEIVQSRILASQLRRYLWRDLLFTLPLALHLDERSIFLVVACKNRYLHLQFTVFWTPGNWVICTTIAPNNNFLLCLVSALSLQRHCGWTYILVDWFVVYHEERDPGCVSWRKTIFTCELPALYVV